MDRDLFERGEDQLRTDVGQIVVEATMAEISAGDPSALPKLFVSLNDSGYTYFDVVQRAHQETASAGHLGFVPDLPVIIPKLVDRILVCSGQRPQQSVDVNIIGLFTQHYKTVGWGSHINEAARAWLKRRG